MQLGGEFAFCLEAVGSHGRVLSRGKSNQTCPSEKFIRFLEKLRYKQRGDEAVAIGKRGAEAMRMREDEVNWRMM